MSDLAEHPTVEAQIRAAVRQNPELSRAGLLETLFSRMFQDLVYPQIWEDPVADMEALGITSRDHLLCIASGGCNMMSYLTAGPASVTAVDLSPAHVALGRLKLAAARHLPGHAELHALFGRADQPGNVALYDQHLAPVLDPASRAYWEERRLGRRRISMFARGFYRFGALGRFIGALHVLCRIGGVDLRPLLEARTQAEQVRFFEERIDPLLNTRMLRLLARQRAALFGLGIPPAQYEKLAADGDGDVLPVLRERLRKLLCDFPLSENYFARQAIGRGYDPAPEAALPPYLQPRNFEALRAHAGRAQVLNRSLTDLLGEKPAGALDCYVLLDAQDWMTDPQLAALWQQITRTAAPGARVIFRTGGRADILPGRVPGYLLDAWRYDAVASERGLRADRSAIYGGFHLYRLAS